MDTPEIERLGQDISRVGLGKRHSQLHRCKASFESRDVERRHGYEESFRFENVLEVEPTMEASVQDGSSRVTGDSKMESSHPDRTLGTDKKVYDLLER